MNTSHRFHIEKEIKVIQPGECYVSAEDEMISTLLGSCVSVCLHDSERRVSGMNHFMLPGRLTHRDILENRSARYGINAINKLLDLMEKAGALRNHLIGKVFGGGHVIDSVLDSDRIPSENVRLAIVMLELEDIPIEEMVVGGAFARKILMEVISGRVFMKSLARGNDIKEIEERESQYFRKVTEEG